MPICHKNKFVFVHIPKAAGTTIEKAFNLHGDNTKFNPDTMFGHHAQHLPYNEIINKSPVDVSQYYSFTFVRNPWDRMVSEYMWRKPLRLKMGSKFTFSCFVKMVRDSIDSSKKLCAHYREQSYFILDDNNNSLVDYIGRVETFQQDLYHICDSLKVQRFDPIKENVTRHKKYTEYYDDETREIVAEKYAKDIEYFNYEFEE